MKISKEEFTVKIHLVISIFIVVPVAFVYGFYPESQFEISPKTIDEHNFQKAIMGLYLGFSTLWILGVFKHQYIKTALMTNMIFMLGLGFGRVISYFFDGIPAPAPFETTFFTGQPKLISIISGFVFSTISTERNMASKSAPKI